MDIWERERVRSKRRVHLKSTTKALCDRRYSAITHILSTDVVTITEGRGEHIDIEREEMYGGYSSGAGWDGRLGTELGQPCHTSE